MARKVRIEYAGACYHVINRGNDRRDLFAGKRAAESFQACLFEAVERFGWRVHAFVIMRNHFHLALETPEPDLSEGMKWLQGTWVARFNRFRGLTGRPFQGRYKALHVEPGESLGRVADYIHLNPVRAKAVTAERLLEYRWSSLPLFAGNERPGWLVAETVLAESGGLADNAAGWRCYLDYLAVGATEDLQDRDAKFGRLSRGWVIGSAEFRADLKEKLAEQAAGQEAFEILGTDREARAAVWVTRLRAAAAALDARLDRLPAKKSAMEKVRLAALMKLGTSVSNGWLAARLQMGVPGAVTQCVRRFRLSEEADKPAFKAALSRIRT